MKRSKANSKGIIEVKTRLRGIKCLFTEVSIFVIRKWLLSSGSYSRQVTYLMNKFYHTNFSATLHSKNQRSCRLVWVYSGFGSFGTHSKNVQLKRPAGGTITKNAKTEELTLSIKTGSIKKSTFSQHSWKSKAISWDYFYSTTQKWKKILVKG